VIDTLRLYEILYVHAIVPPAGEDEAPDPDGYCLVSRKPYCISESPDLDAFRGWVPNNRIFVWDHREAVEFNKDPEALEWRTEQDKPIRAYESKLDAMTQDNVAYEEVLSTGPWKYYQQRFPIIDREMEVDGVEYLKIGVIGDSYTGNRKIAVGLEAQIQNQIEVLKQGVRNLDVLIVVDATGSMLEFYESIGATVDVIQKAIAGTKVSSIRYGVTFYRDYSEEKNPDSWVHFYRDLQEGSEFRKQFDAQSPEFVISKGGNNNPPPFYALHTGVNSVNWRDDSTRMAVLIGDMGNEVPDSRQYTLDGVVAELDRKGCSFFAIQTQPGVDHPRCKQFNEQAVEIARRLNMPFQEVLYPEKDDLSEALTQNFHTSSLEIKLLEEILQGLREGRGIGDQTADVLRRNGLTQTGTQAASYKGDWGLYIKDRVLDHADNAGIDTDLLLNSRIQQFAFAYCPAQQAGSPHSQLKTRVFMSSADLGQVISQFRKLKHQTLTNHNVDAIWRAILNGFLGERETAIQFDENLPISQYMSKALALPTRSEYLNMSLRELKNLEPEEMLAMVEEILDKVDKLDNFMRDKRLDGTGTQKNGFTVNDIKFYWVPIELFP